MIETLVEKKLPELEVAIMDSYLLTHFHEVIKQADVRVNANLEQAINYGLVLAENSENFTKCFTRYIRNNPQDIFDSIRKNLKPLKVRLLKSFKLREIGLENTANYQWDW